MIKLSDDDIWFFWQQDEDQSLDDERLSQLNFYLTSYVPENASDSQKYPLKIFFKISSKEHIYDWLYQNIKARIKAQYN